MPLPLNLKAIFDSVPRKEIEEYLDQRKSEEEPVTFLEVLVRDVLE